MSIVKIESVKSYKEHSVLTQVSESSNTKPQKVLCTDGGRITAEFEMLSGLFVGRSLLDELDNAYYTDREGVRLVGILPSDEMYVELNKLLVSVTDSNGIQYTLINSVEIAQVIQDTYTKYRDVYLTELNSLVSEMDEVSLDYHDRAKKHAVLLALFRSRSDLLIPYFKRLEEDHVIQVVGGEDLPEGECRALSPAEWSNYLTMVGSNAATHEDKGKVALVGFQPRNLSLGEIIDDRILFAAPHYPSIDIMDIKKLKEHHFADKRQELANRKLHRAAMRSKPNHR